ncbi:uncharacterized protein LTR77_009827 [Saxophila tyrrhenica]|uniref:Inositol polyphosphate-related phosphatase domain-containing protein n=1 Tax=Saxophila tyrrhenica TaxID=1690608 RepID=A0AAV9NXL9_9PEZI|nr:hypothetical protein LTR77_009827 [Saxophila tyrrhenica]
MERTDRKDESSIGPVSSLRSRFENLQQDKGTPPVSPIAGRLPFSTGPPQTTTSRPTTPALGGSSHGASALPHLEPPQAVPRLRTPNTPLSRPHSMASTTPTLMSPPLLTVDSPHSPGRKNMSVDLRSPDTTAPNLTAAPHSPTKAHHGRTLSRTASPALEARMSAFLQASDVPKAQSDGALTAPPTPEMRPQSHTTSVPPPVNRAGKPNVPVKPSNLAQKADSLTAPEPIGDVVDQGASPFSTPPGSGTSSPRRPTDANRGRNDSSASLTHRMRTASDASFVELLRTNSGSSVPRSRFDSNASLIERARAGSNASFVEPSSLPDSWNHPSTPPLPNPVTARRDQQANGMPRPARYRTTTVPESTAAEDFAEDRPRLPSRPELQMRPGRTSPPKARSGRTSPVKQMFEKHAFEGPKRAVTLDGAQTPPRIPASKQIQKSALNQGFDRDPASSAPAPKPSASVPQPAPPVPAPRRSMDHRREMPAPATIPATKPAAAPAPLRANGHSHDDQEDYQLSDFTGSQATAPSDYPDSSQASRRPPKYRKRPWQIPTEYDTRTFAVCGEYVCTTGHRTKVWSLRTGELLVDMEHPDIKVSSLVFKPAASADDEGSRIWLGTSVGEIHELDVPSQAVVKTRTNAHTRKEIIRIFRYASELWTLDDSGDLNVWKSDHTGSLSLDSQFTSYRTVRGHTYSIVLGKHLWHAAGKEIQFQVVWNPLSQFGTGEVHSGATLSAKPDLVYFGHQDGKVSIYNRNDFSCTAVVNVSMYKLSSMAGVGEYLWAGFNTGMAYVYDTSTIPWTVKKDWRAHEKQICGISADRSALWKLDRLQVVSLGTDNLLKIWDGMLEEDWLEARMQDHDSEYCSFDDLTAAVLTWNAGATKPGYLQHNKEDNNFFREYISSRQIPDIFVFGFQELVDLEDKKMTAKSFFKSKKKDANEQEHMGHQYRTWRDHLTRCLDEFTPSSHTYVLLHSASLVGLFTCVFVKSKLRSRVKHVHASEVKRGMAGYHGNKGALIVRMVLDDSSICLINCHLAAGQTQTIHRNNDVAAILEAETLPSYPLSNDSVAQHADVFTSGGDGSMILDHEICILNGDLNYRIDTMGRDTVVKHVHQNSLGRLLERDQLLLTKKRNPGFRLRAFQESEIRFAPTYKYNLQSDDYDTSEKRRAPAWCDRILYRGIGKVKMDEYKRWTLRVSDHRPVSGLLRIRVKTADEARRAQVWELCQQEFEVVRKRVARNVQLEHLVGVLGLSGTEAKAALR